MSAEALHQHLSELILGLCGTLQPTFSVAIVPLEEISCRKQTVNRRSGPSRGGGVRAHLVLSANRSQTPHESNTAAKSCREKQNRVRRRPKASRDAWKLTPNALHEPFLFTPCHSSSSQHRQPAFKLPASNHGLTSRWASGARSGRSSSSSCQQESTSCWLQSKSEEKRQPRLCQQGTYLI